MRNQFIGCVDHTHLILTEQRKVEEYFQWLSVGCHHYELGYSPIQSFGCYSENQTSRFRFKTNPQSGTQQTFISSLPHLLVVGGLLQQVENGDCELRVSQRKRLRVNTTCCLRTCLREWYEIYTTRARGRRISNGLLTIVTPH